MATCFSLSFFRNLRKTSPSRSVSGETLCVKAICDMIRHFSTLFTAVMTDIEDLRQVARIARGEGWALDVLIHRHACYRKTSGGGLQTASCRRYSPCATKPLNFGGFLTALEGNK